MERRHNFRDQKIAEFAISAKFLNDFFQTTYILGVYMTVVTTFENDIILRESTFKTALPYLLCSALNLPFHFLGHPT